MTAEIERSQYRELTILSFPPSMLSLYAAGTTNTVRPTNVQDAVAATHPDAALDGPMFEKCNPGDSYQSQPCGHVLYRHYDLTGGIDIPSVHPNQGVTISVLADGTAQAARGAAVPPGATVAVQLYPEMVANGTPVPVRPGDAERRAALAIMRDGRLAFIASTPMTNDQFGIRLAQAGALYAGYTDGGGSTSLQTPTGYVGSSEHRRVLTWLLAKARQSTVLQTAADHPAGTAIVLVGLAGLGWYLWRRR